MATVEEIISLVNALKPSQKIQLAKAMRSTKEGRFAYQTILFGRNTRQVLEEKANNENSLDNEDPIS